MNVYAPGEAPNSGFAVPGVCSGTYPREESTDQQQIGRLTGTAGGGTLMPMGLTEFLMARIAEDEEAAKAVKDIGADVWDVEVVRRSPDVDRPVTHWSDDKRTILAQHFDPDRVLAVCDATRLIMAMHSAYEPTGMPVYAPEWSENDWCVGCCYSSEEERITEHIDDCPILRALALPFAGHPDFRDEWSR